jgi:hypothetical protein
LVLIPSIGKVKMRRAITNKLDSIHAIEIEEDEEREEAT